MCAVETGRSALVFGRTVDPVRKLSLCPGLLHTNSLYCYCHRREIVLSLLLPEQNEIIKHQMQLKFISGELNSLLVRITNLIFEATMRNVIGKVINSSKIN